MINHFGSPVSIVIVNHNAGALLVDCVHASLEQGKQVIIVDNASSDTSLALVEARFAHESRLQVIRTGCNLGFATACNIGAANSSEELILFLNPDCLLGEHSLARMVRVLEAGADTGMVGGLLMNPDGTEQGGGRRAVPTPWRSFVHAFGLSRLSSRWPRLFNDYHNTEQFLPDKPMEVEAISGACMLVKRDAIKVVGSWDEQYFLHCEDLDWCMRFRQTGWKIVFVPDATVVHHKGTCSRSRPIFVEWHKHRGMMRFYHKFFRHQYPGVLMWLVKLAVWMRFSILTCYHLGRSLTRLAGGK